MNIAGIITVHPTSTRTTIGFIGILIVCLKLFEGNSGDLPHWREKFRVCGMRWRV